MSAGTFTTWFGESPSYVIPLIRESNMSARRGVEGLWDALYRAETGATSKLSRLLEPYEPAVRTCFEAGVEVPTLPTSNTQPMHLRDAAVFLKRTLTDLRATWILVAGGYTAAVAATAAALWENALAAACLARGGPLVDELDDSQSGDLPWRPQRLAQEWAKTLDDDYEVTWLQIYGGYKWLCKIKHPTLRAAMHEAGSASVRSGEFVVMASPDVRVEDLPVKVAILSIALMRTQDAVESFRDGMSPDLDSAEYHAFEARLNSIDDLLRPFFDGMDLDLPFDIRDDKNAERYRRARMGEGDAPSRHDKD